MKASLMDFMDALLPVVAVAFEKQLYLSEVVSNRPWAFSMGDERQLSFGHEYAFKVQLLGTEGDAAGTWLWSWANEASGIPAPLLKSAEQLRQYGQQHDIRELVDAEIPLDEFHNGHYFSLLASGLLKANGYYRGPYQGGALFMLIDDPDFPADDRDPMQRITFTFPQLISAITLSDHRTAFVGYAQAHQLAVTDDASSDTVQVQAPNGQTIEATFDSNRRLLNLEGKLFK
jgi:hypothetical protein